MHVTESHNLSNVLTLKNDFKTKVCKFMYSAEHNNFPNIFSNYFSEIQGVHTYDASKHVTKIIS